MTTRNELAERYGPQTTQIEALLERARNLTDEETEAIREAREAREAQDAWVAWGTARPADRDAAWEAAWEAAWAAWDADWEAAWYAARYAVLALVVRDLIGQNGFTQEHYDMLVAPWESVMGTTWTRETL